LVKLPRLSLVCSEKDEKEEMESNTYKTKDWWKAHVLQAFEAVDINHDGDLSVEVLIKLPFLSPSFLTLGRKKLR
jgi:hypothetical protein